MVAHQNNGHPLYQSSFYEDRLFIAGSEAAAHYPGYMNGAVAAAEAVVERIKRVNGL